MITGHRLKQWSKKARHQRLGFAHEQGAGIYHEFDIMLRPQKSANGVSLNYQPNARWPNAIVPYVLEGNYSSTEIPIIRAAMNQFASTTCLRFVPRTTEANYLTISNNETGCSSYVGMSTDNTLNFVSLQSPACITISTVAHELMHAIGFNHEVSRPDRDEWITIDTGALDKESNNALYIETNYKKLAPEQVELYGIPYNYGTVMHYSRYGSAASDTRPVLVNKKPWDGEFGTETGLAPVDILAVKKMYCGA